MTLLPHVIMLGYKKYRITNITTIESILINHHTYTSLALML